MYNTNLLTQLYVQLQVFFCCTEPLSKRDSTEEDPILPLNSKSKSQGHLELGTFEDLDEQTVKTKISTLKKINVDFTEEDLKNQIELKEYTKTMEEMAPKTSEEKTPKTSGETTPKINILKVPSFDSLDELNSNSSSDKKSPPPPLEELEPKTKEKETTSPVNELKTTLDSDVFLSDDEEDDELFQSILDASNFEKM
jgi:hypothetical protein